MRANSRIVMVTVMVIVMGTRIRMMSRTIVAGGDDMKCTSDLYGVVDSFSLSPQQIV